MAGTIQGLSIGLGLDTTGIDKSLKELKGRLKGVDSEMKLAMSAFSRGEKSVEKYETQIGGLTKKMQAQEQAVASAKREHERMVSVHGEGSRQANDAATAYNNLAADMNNLERYTNDVRSEFEQFRTELENSESRLGRMSETMGNLGESFSRVGDKMKNVGKTMSTYITAPLLGAAAASAKFAIDQEKNFAQVTTLLTGSGKEMTAYKENIRASSSEMGIAFDEYAESVYGSISAGVAQADAIEFTANAAKLAKGGFTDTATAVDVMTTAINAYGLEASDATNISDMLINTQNLGKTTVDELAASMGAVIPVAKGQNVEMDQLSTGYAVLTKNGIATSEAGTYMKSMFGELGKAGSKVDKVLREQTGKSFSELSAEGMNVGEVLQIIQKDAENSGLKMGDLFGSMEAGSAAMVLAGGEGKEFNEILASMSEVAGTTDTAFAKMNDTTGAKMEKAFNSIKNTAAGIGDLFLPYIAQLADKISGLMEKFSNISPKMQVFGVIIAGVAAAIGPVLVVIGTFISMLGGVMTALAPVLMKIQQAGGLFKYLRGAMIALSGPIGITVAILAGLTIGFIALYKNSETFREGVSKLITKVKELATQALVVLKPAISAVVSFFKDQLATIQQFWSENSEVILSALSNIGKVVSTIFNGIMTVIQFVMPAVLALIKSVWGNIQGVISGALDIIMGAVKVFAGLFSGDFAKMWDGLKQMFSGAVEFLWNFVSLTLFGKLLGGVKIFVTAFKGVFTTMWATLKTVFSGAVGTLKTTVSNAWSSISSTTTTIFTTIWTTIKNMFSKIFGSVKDIGTQIFNNIKTNFTNIFNTTSSIFNTVWTFIKSIFAKMRDSIASLVGNILTKVTGTWTTLKTKTTEIFGAIYNGIKGKFDDIVNAAKNLPQRIGDGIGSMASKVKSGVTKVINELASTLGKGVNGVIGGINWVLGKIGVESKVPKWDVPKYAQGTKGHPGGLAQVTDGVGSNAGQELIMTPSGELSMSPKKKNSIINLPKGSEVLSASKTRELIASMPRYANGVGGFLSDAWQGTKNLAGKAWEGTKSIGNKVKEKAFDVFDHLTNPSKLLTTALDILGISSPKGGSFVGDMAKGAFNKVKDGAVGYLKKSIDGFGTMAGSGQGFGSAFRVTSRRGMRVNPVTGEWKMHQGDDLGARLGTLIPAQAAGKVIESGYHSIRGNFVRVKSGIMDRLYQHNQRNMVKVGQTVKKGQAVGTVGSTGRSTGPHLHYEVRRNGVNINPAGLATGGVINKEQLIRAGEGNKKEIMIPLDPARRTDAMKLLALAGRKLMPGNDKGITRPSQLPNVSRGASNSNDNVLKSLLAATLKQNEILMKLLTKDSNVYMDSGALVGAIGNDMDSELGNKAVNEMFMSGVRR